MVNQKIFSFVSRHRGAPILNLCRYHHTVNQRVQVSQVFRKDHRNLYLKVIVKTIQDDDFAGKTAIVDSDYDALTECVEVTIQTSFSISLFSDLTV